MGTIAAASSSSMTTSCCASPESRRRCCAPDGEERFSRGASRHVGGGASCSGNTSGGGHCGWNHRRHHHRRLGGSSAVTAARGISRIARMSTRVAEADDGSGGASVVDDVETKKNKHDKRAIMHDAVEEAWRAGGGLLEGATEESVVRTVRGTIQVARHYAALIEQQKFNFGKYGEGPVLPDTHADPLWVAGRLCVVSRVTGVPPQHLPAMVESGGAGVLELEATAAMRVMLALKDLLPNADASHMVRVEPDLLLVDDPARLMHGGADAMTTLRAIPMPEPCVRLLLQEEPGLMLGKGGLVRLEQVRDQTEEYRANVEAICRGVPDDGWLDVDSQRWFTNFFCGYY